MLTGSDRIQGSAEIGGAYIYTNRGNVRFRSKDDSDAGLGFEYDLANRITRTSTSGNVTLATYTYDGDGLRRGKDLCCDESEDITASFRYTVDYATQIPLVLDDGHTSFIWAGSTLLYAIPWSGRWGLSTTPWEQSAEPATGPFVAIADGQGSITTWTNNESGSSARLKWVQQTDLFGQRVPGTGNLANGLEHLLSMGYTGEQHDPESNLIYLRARSMDPTTGRFMSRDTFAGYASRPQSQNRYGYAGGNPINRKDPSGHQPVLNQVTFKVNTDKAGPFVKLETSLYGTSTLITVQARTTLYRLGDPTPIFVDAPWGCNSAENPAPCGLGGAEWGQGLALDPGRYVLITHFYIVAEPNELLTFVLDPRARLFGGLYGNWASVRIEYGFEISDSFFQIFNMPFPLPGSDADPNSNPEGSG